MRIKEIEDFQTLKNEWNMLLKRNVLGDNVFLTWEWLSTWWKHFGAGRKLLLLAVEDDGEIIALAPLMLSKYQLPILGTIRKIEFIGVRHSDYNNFIILKKEASCLKLIISHLMAVADWDWIELKEIPENEENPDFLRNLLSSVESGLKLNQRVHNICPYIPLPNSFDILLGTLSKNMRQNLNKYLRRIRSTHKIEFRRYDEAGF
ncbi:MAG: GNAT family N-acetyltransferase, partial [Fervidobacterium sp.]